MVKQPKPSPEREHILSKDCWCQPRVEAYGDTKDV